MDVQITDNSEEILDGFRRQKAAALEAIGVQCEGYAVLLAPTDTGNLKNSMTHAPEGEDTMCIGTPVLYAKYVEFGHRQKPGRFVPAIGKRLVKAWVPPKPFLRPAVQNHLDEYKAIAEHYLRNG